MRKHAAVVTLSILEVVAAALAAFFWLVMRPDLLASYGARPLPFGAALSMSGWFVPVTGLGGAALVLVALWPSWRTKTRTYLASTGFLCTVFGLAFAIWVSYAPIFEGIGRG